MQNAGFNLKNELKWSFFFINKTRSELEKVYDEMKEKNYRIEKLEEVDTGEWVLQVSKMDVLTPEKLHKRNIAFNDLADYCNIDLYDGWDVSKENG